MEKNSAFFYEMILDNLSDAIFVLDNEGNFVFVNSTYSDQLRMKKDELLKCNVRNFLDTEQIDSCISDLVYREKRQVIQFQDVYDTLNTGRKSFRQLVIATPIFDENGEVRNVIAVLRPLKRLNREYYMASLSDVASSKMRGIPSIPGENDIVAESDAMRGILAAAKEIANTDATVLITGDSGTGKEVVARYIHECSDRKNKPFVVINCASLPESLLEAELFGYEKGSFTGASSTGKKGLFEEADHGTLFLDEINSLPISLQGKLLRAIETKTIQHIGAYKGHPVDFRLLVATNEDIEKLVQENKFRADLYYRIDVVPINIPPLRERRKDIVPLALKFLDIFCQKNGRTKSFSPQMLENMENYNWPGNVRELKNFVERSVLMSMEQNIKLPSISDFSGSSRDVRAGKGGFDERLLFSETGHFEQMVDDGITLDSYVESCEKDFLQWALEKYGSTYKAAAALGTSQASVMRRKKKYLF